MLTVISAVEKLFVSGGMDRDAMQAAGMDDAGIAAAMDGHQHGAADDYNRYFVAASFTALGICIANLVG